jgi:hypothetical protein
LPLESGDELDLTAVGSYAASTGVLSLLPDLSRADAPSLATISFARWLMRHADRSYVGPAGGVSALSPGRSGAEALPQLLALQTRRDAR